MTMTMTIKNDDNNLTINYTANNNDNNDNNNNDNNNNTMTTITTMTTMTTMTITMTTITIHDSFSAGGLLVDCQPTTGHTSSLL